MAELVECKHPDLPEGQTAFLTSPRNGWKPLTKKEKDERAKAEKAEIEAAAERRAALRETSPLLDAAGTDSPAAGPSSNPTQ